MNHPIVGFELEELEKRSRHYLMHVGDSNEQYALFLNAFFATEYVNPRVLQAVAERFAGVTRGGDGQ